MRHLLASAFFGLLLVSGVSAETLGEATLEIRQEATKILDRYSTRTPDWGDRTALQDVDGIARAAQNLYEGLGGHDADQITSLQTQLKTKARRAKTSSVLMSSEAQAQINSLLPKVERVDQRLTALRLRFGGEASVTGVALRDVPVESNSPETYSNHKELLIDVRAARERVRALRAGRAYSGGLFTDGQPNNLDPLQLQRLINAAWALERRLSASSTDISHSRPAWERFRREYRLMDYPGSNFNVRQLDRIMRRLEGFYGSQV